MVRIFSLIVAFGMTLGSVAQSYFPFVIHPAASNDVPVLGADLNNRGEVMAVFQLDPTAGSNSVESWKPAAPGQANSPNATQLVTGPAAGIKLTDSGKWATLGYAGIGSRLYSIGNGIPSVALRPGMSQSEIADIDDTGRILVNSRNLQNATTNVADYTRSEILLPNGEWLDVRQIVPGTGDDGRALSTIDGLRLNRAGDIAGWLVKDTRVFDNRGFLSGWQRAVSGFIWRNGIFTLIPAGGSTTYVTWAPYDLNEKGQVLFDRIAADRSSQQYLYFPEPDYGFTFTGLNGPIAEATSTPPRLNEQGQIAGFEWYGTTNIAPQIWSRATWLDIRNFTLPTTGLTLRSALRINNAGQILALGKVPGFTNDLPILLTPALSVTLAWDTEAIDRCEDAVLTARVENHYGDALTQIFPAAPGLVYSGPATNPVMKVIAGPTPAMPQTIPAGTNMTFKWTIRGRRAGEAQFHLAMSGQLAGQPVTSPDALSPIATVAPAPIVVNSTGDEADADPGDLCPDADALEPGLQATLRAAIETVNQLADTNQVILFKLPSGSLPVEGATIHVKSPLPALTVPVELRGQSQPGGWVGIDGAAYGGGTLNALLECGGKATLRGLTFTHLTNTVAIWLRAADSVVENCRFGLTASGQATPGASIGILASAGNLEIGSATPGRGNVFTAGKIGVLAQADPGSPALRNIIVEGNQFGLAATDDALGTMQNPVVFRGVSASRVGGTTESARNLFIRAQLAAVVLEREQTADNDVLGNWFGLTSSGAATPADDGAVGYGVVIAYGAHHNRIGAAAGRNIISNVRLAGVLLTFQAHDNSVAGNWFGVASDGFTPVANDTGVWVQAGKDNQIGGITPAERNVISGGIRFGVVVGRPSYSQYGSPDLNPGAEPVESTVIEGNWIGLDASGTRSVPNGRAWNNGAGINISHFATGTRIGGNTPGPRNVISGNDRPGILVEAAEPNTTHTIVGNFIGTSPDGQFPRPNKAPGIQVLGSAAILIGGTNSGQANRIAFNTGPGVDLSQAQGSFVLNGNLIYGNELLRNIALGPHRTPNDPGDTDTGPNGKQNWPLLLLGINRSNVTVMLFDLSSFKPGISVRTDFFHHQGGGGDQWLGSQEFVTGTSEQGLYPTVLPLQSVGTEIIALATTDEGTSEFSAPTLVAAGTDSDGDGTPDIFERNVPLNKPKSGGLEAQSLQSRTPAPGDRNGDGLPDETQPNVSSAEIPGTGVWLTVAVRPGLVLSNLGGLRPADLPPLGRGFVLSPGALRLDIGGSRPAQGRIEIWMPASATPVTLWLRHANTWLPLDIVETAVHGDLVAVSAQVSVEESPLILALGAPSATVSADLPSLSGPVLLPGASDQFVGGAFEGDAPVAASPVRGAFESVTLNVPTNGGQWELETSTDLLNWTKPDVWSEPGGSTLTLQFPASEQARFFRWRLQ